MFQLRLDDGKGALEGGQCLRQVAGSQLNLTRS